MGLVRAASAVFGHLPQLTYKNPPCYDWSRVFRYDLRCRGARSSGKKDNNLASLTRQEFKKDEFADHLAGFQEFFLQKQQLIIKTVLALVVGIGVVIGAYYFVQSRKSHASADFAKALTTFHSPAAMTQQPGSNTAQYLTEEQ